MRGYAIFGRSFSIQDRKLLSHPGDALDNAELSALVQHGDLLFSPSRAVYRTPARLLSLGLPWPASDTLHQLGRYVDDEVMHNDRALKLSGYRDILVKGFHDIPDLRFNVQLLICEPPRVAARLAFECSPKGEFLGVSNNGRKVSCTENVFYECKNLKIAALWSVIDKTAIEAQLLQ